MCVFTLAWLIPRSSAISFVDRPPATARRTSLTMRQRGN
jgi:hypothetical protein